MKFKDPKTGRIFDPSETDCSRSGFCENIKSCLRCPIREARIEVYGDESVGMCVTYVTSHPAEAARLMGYELVDDHSTDPTKKVEIPASSMTAMEYITYTFGRDEIFCQTAEESVELAQACDDLRRASMKLSKAVLKLRRAEHGTTPVSLTEATRAVLEECADVTVCIRALESMGVFTDAELDGVVREKLERWESRALEYEKRSGGNDSCC